MSLLVLLAYIIGFMTAGFYGVGVVTVCILALVIIGSLFE